MNLYSRKFEKTLRRSVRKRVRASQELKREFKHANKLRKNYRAASFIRPLVSVFVGFMCWKIYSETNHIGAALAALSLWSLTIMFYRALNFPQCLFADSDLTAFSVLPVEASAVFRRQVRKFFLKSLYVLADIVAGLVALGCVAKFSLWQWLMAAPTALIAWVTLLSAAILCATKIPTFVSIVVGIFSIGWVGVIFIEKIVSLRWLLAVLDRYADWLNRLLPTGWSLSLLQPFIEPGHWLNFCLLLPACLLWWLASRTLIRVRADYFFTEITRDEMPDHWPVEDLAEENTIAGQRPKHFGNTAIEELVQSRVFLAALPWQTRGWLERWLWRWLNVREKVLMELAFPEGIKITSRWKTVARNLAVALLAGFAIGTISESWKLWVVGCGIVITFVQVLNLMLDTGRAFQATLCSGVNVPFYAIYGIGFRELARTFFKYSAVQLPAMVVWSVICGAAITHLAGLTIVDGMMHGLRAGGVVFAARFALIVFNFSGGTNDSSGRGLGTLFVFITIVGFGGLFLILGLLGLLIPGHLPGLAITLVAMLAAYVMFRVYGWSYHRNKFDLMSLPRS